MGMHIFGVCVAFVREGDGCHLSCTYYVQFTFMMLKAKMWGKTKISQKFSKEILCSSESILCLAVTIWVLCYLSLFLVHQTGQLS